LNNSKLKNDYQMLKDEFNESVEIPKDWKLKPIGKLGKIIPGGTPNSSINEFWNGNVLWAVPSDITKLKTRYIENTEKKLPKKD